MSILTKAMNPEVKSVEPLADFKLLVQFVTGERRRFDVKPLLGYPVYQRLSNEGYFYRARVENGTVVWDEQCDVSPDSLYLQGEVV